MILNDAGIMVEKIWLIMKKEYKNIDISEYIIMPNHFHCLIEILGAESISAQNPIKMPNENISKNRVDMESTPTTTTIPNILQTFKRYTTIEYIKMVKENILPAFDKRIWQRNYYENIIRNEKQYIMVSEYIKNNPLKWKDDKYYEKS